MAVVKADLDRLDPRSCRTRSAKRPPRPQERSGTKPGAAAPCRHRSLEAGEPCKRSDAKSQELRAYGASGRRNPNFPQWAPLAAKSSGEKRWAQGLGCHGDDSSGASCLRSGHSVGRSSKRTQATVRELLEEVITSYVPCTACNL